jgi:ankyrin repeat protein
MGDVEAIRRLVSQSATDMERRMDMVNRRPRPLHLAVIKKQPQALLTLLDLGANMESLDEAGFTALDQAALIGESKLAQILLDRGAKVRLPAAICLGRTTDINRLLQRDPDILKPGGRWENLILRAAERAPGTVIETLIQAGASVHVRDDPKTSVDSTSGYTPLHAAAFNGNLSAASVLLQHGANVRAREEKYHGTPAGWANYAGHADIRDLILRGPIDIMEAVEHGLTNRIQTILEEDPEALHRPFSEYPLYPLYAEGWHTPLAFAVVARNKPETVRFLLNQGAAANVRSPEGKTLYQLAKESGHDAIAAMLTP